MAKWLIPGYSILQSCSKEKGPWYPCTSPFIEGTAGMGSLLVTYSVLSHRMHHLPEVRDDAFNVMCQTMPVGITQTGMAQPITSMLHVGAHHNQAFGLDYECTWKSRCKNVTGQFVLPLHLLFKTQINKKINR